MDAEENNLDLLLPIVQIGDPVLRLQAVPVTTEEISSPGLQRLVDQMISTLAASGGIGLAANQVGVAKRIIVIQIPPATRVGYGETPEVPLTVILNPEIVFVSANMRLAPEGCLSIQSPDGKGHYEGVVERPDIIHVKGLDRHGHELVVEGDRLFGRALQHEIDHLNGVLFVDLIRQLKDLRIVYRLDPSTSDLGLLLEQNPFISDELRSAAY